MKETDFNFLWLLNLCKDHFKLLLSILFITTITSSLVAVFLVDSQFRSSVVIYPTTTSSVSKALFKQARYGQDVLEFGEEEDAEELLQILNSDEIRDSIIYRFDLYNHYEISQNDVSYKTKIIRKYNSHVTFKKTQFNSIEIVVFDKSPQLAADIANECLSLIDSVITRIRQKRANQALEILEMRKKLLYKERNITQDSLKTYRSYGIISITAQTERLTEQYAVALATNNLSGARRIKKELNTLAKHAGPHDMLLRKSYEIEEELIAIQFEFDRVSIDTNYSLENKFIINKAYPADKKSYPIRWLVVLSSLVAVFVFTLLTFCLLEYMNSSD